MVAKRPDLLQRYFVPKIVYKPDGPLWYRDLAMMHEETFAGEIQEILHNLGVNYMVIAHTPQVGSPVIGNEELSKFQGKVWIIDTGISHFPGGVLTALVIKNGDFNIEVIANEN